MRTLTSALVLLLATLVVQVTAADVALAHAELSSSDPKAGARLDTLPEVAQLTFTEVVGQPAVLSVTGPDGAEVADGDVEVVDDTLTRALDTGAGPVKGTYTISYQVTSADGHPISGTLTFTVTTGRAPDGEPAALPVDTTGNVGTGLVLALVAGLLLALAVAVVGVARLVGRSPDD